MTNSFWRTTISIAIEVENWSTRTDFKFPLATRNEDFQNAFKKDNYKYYGDE